MKAYQAYGSDGSRVTKSTPRQAALAFFEQFPNKRKCDVVEGTTDGTFFTLVVMIGKGKGLQSWKDVTKKTSGDLPDTVDTAPSAKIEACAAAC